MLDRLLQSIILWLRTRVSSSILSAEPIAIDWLIESERERIIALIVDQTRRRPTFVLAFDDTKRVCHRREN